MIRKLLLTAFLAPALLAEVPQIAGRWSWDMLRGDGEKTTVRMTIKQEGTNVTGAMTTFNQDTPIKDVELHEDGAIAFVMRRERNGQVFETKYKGQVVGQGKIEGKMEVLRNGETRIQDWNATLIARPDEYFTDKWKVRIKRPDASELESEVTLKQEKGQLTGKSRLANGTESPVVEGQVNDREAAFVVKRERDGRELISKFVGKLETDNVMKGKVITNWGGDGREFEFEAQRLSR